MINAVYSISLKNLEYFLCSFFKLAAKSNIILCSSVNENKIIHSTMEMYGQIFLD